MGFFDRFNKSGVGTGGNITSAAGEKMIRNDKCVAAILTVDTKMRAILRRKGLRKEGPETDRQFFRRVEQTVSVDLNAMYDFQHCVEEARFSNHPVSERERDRCISDFRNVNGSLGKAQAGGVNVTFRPWVVPPPFGAYAGSNIAPATNMREVERSETERDALVEAISSIGPRYVPPLKNSVVENMKNAIAKGDFEVLGKILYDQVRGSAANLKLYFDKPLATWIMEWGYRMAETGLLVNPPSLDAHERMIHGACVLAIAEGRDFIIPDEIKLAILSLSSEDYRVGPAESIRMLETVPLPYL